MSRTDAAPPTRTDFDAELEQVIAIARRQHLRSVDVFAGHLHQQVGGYPPARGHHHRMPQAVAAMRALARASRRRSSLVRAAAKAPVCRSATTSRLLRRSTSRGASGLPPGQQSVVAWSLDAACRNP